MKGSLGTFPRFPTFNRERRRLTMTKPSKMPNPMRAKRTALDDELDYREKLEEAVRAVIYCCRKTGRDEVNECLDRIGSALNGERPMPKFAEIMKVCGED